MSIIHVIVRVTVPTEHQSKVLSLTEELVSESRKESGNIYYHFIKVDGSENDWIVFEAWKSLEDIEIHNKTSHYMKVLPQLSQLVTFHYVNRAPDLGDIPLVNPFSTINMSKGMLLLVVEVKLIGDENEFTNLAKQMGEKSKQEEGGGCLLYTFGKVEVPPSALVETFYFIEIWASDAALDAHRATTHCAELIPKLDAVSTVVSFIKSYFME